jgi:hypothetical protein
MKPRWHHQQKPGNGEYRQQHQPPHLNLPERTDLLWISDYFDGTSSKLPIGTN